MIKKILKIIILIMITLGIYFGISIAFKRNLPELSKKDVESKIFRMIQTKTAEITKFYTYGRSFNVEGKIDNISKDNFESAKIVVTDGENYEKEYNLNYTLEENVLIFALDKEINSGIILDELTSSEYYVLLRLKLNNSIEPRFYSFKNVSDYKNIDYYTITSEDTNKKVVIEFSKKIYEKNEYSLLTINFENIELPENVYDIVIDAGHGGSDTGENAGNITEANVTLEYAKMLQNSLEEAGYKVKMTRDDLNTGLYTATNMYDADGRITLACSSKAKLMISFHINNGNNGLKGFEIYSPCKSNLDFAKEMSNKIKEYSSIEYSNNNSFKEYDGVYVRNFTKSVINEFRKTAEKKGYEHYNMTKDTPYLYTIREVGGIATGAYVDGRNTAYAKNEYYNSNQGIECYQIELGYIKNDLNIIVNEKENYIRAITETIKNNY